jgi:protein-S-isoprenylcysteine O-methyltransferase Ste14
MKWLDLPPVWLAGALALVLAQDRYLPLGGPGGAHLLGGALVGLGLALMGAAAVEMARARTTIIPHRDPHALVTSGIFRLSRNPIYLGDALVLAGVSVWLGAWLGLLLVPVFMALIVHRFILAEEERLRQGFGPAFSDWAATTRRWL